MKPKAEIKNKGGFSWLGLAEPEGRTQEGVGSDLLRCLLFPPFLDLYWKEVAEVLYQRFLHSDNQEYEANNQERLSQSSNLQQWDTWIPLQGGCCCLKLGSTKMVPC